jgi:ADP-heptose:LPS heptosyltransferase
MRKLNKKLAYRAKIIDSFLKFFIAPFLKKKSSTKIQDFLPKSILILDFHLIGDMVLLTPLLINLRGMYPNAVIGLVAGPWAKEVLLNHPNLFDYHFPIISPWVKKISLLEGLLNILKCLRLVRKKTWDLGIEVRGDLRQIFFMFLCRTKFLLGYSFTGGGWLLDFIVPDDGVEKHMLRYHYQIIKFLGSDIEQKLFIPKLWLSDLERASTIAEYPYVGIHLGATHDLRRLPDIMTIDLIKFILKSASVKVVIFDAPDIKNLHKILDLLDPEEKKLITFYSGALRDFIVMLSKCGLFIGMDSGGGHLAAALNVPTVSIFGPSMSQITSPIGSNVHFLESSNSELMCRPCNGDKCVNVVFKECFKTINLEEINEILNNYGYKKF